MSRFGVKKLKSFFFLFFIRVCADQCGQAQHKGYNQYLNSLVADASPQNPKNRNSSIARVPVNYVHLRETDRFYKLSEEARNCFHPVLLNMMRRDASLRVTREQKTGQVVAKIVKVKVADLHLMFPQCDLDCRITVNVEATYDGPVEQLEQIPGDAAAARAGKPDRHKDRLSYTQGNYKVDLTQVTQPDAGGQVCTQLCALCVSGTLTRTSDSFQKGSRTGNRT